MLEEDWLHEAFTVYFFKIHKYKITEGVGALNACPKHYTSALAHIFTLLQLKTIFSFVRHDTYRCEKIFSICQSLTFCSGLRRYQAFFK